MLTTLKFIMEALIPDVPEGVTVQRDRNKLFADAVLKKDLPPVVSKVQNVHSLTHSLTHSFTHTLTHSLGVTRGYAVRC